MRQGVWETAQAGQHLPWNRLTLRVWKKIAVRIKLLSWLRHFTLQMCVFKDTCCNVLAKGRESGTAKRVNKVSQEDGVIFCQVYVATDLRIVILKKLFSTTYTRSYQINSSDTHLYYHTSHDLKILRRQPDKSPGDERQNLWSVAAPVLACLPGKRVSDFSLIIQPVITGGQEILQWW